jgi:hypothetical protein
LALRSAAKFASGKSAGAALSAKKKQRRKTAILNTKHPETVEMILQKINANGLPFAGSRLFMRFQTLA